MQIYLAGALFSLAEKQFNRELAETLEFYDYEVYLPQEECAGLTSPNQIYRKCIEGVTSSQIIVAILEGTDVDSGTAVEIGMATMVEDKCIIGVRTDFRQHGDDGGLNLMVSCSCETIITGETIKSIAEKINEYIKINYLK